MVAVRITGYGPDYNISVNCPHCNHLNKESVNLSELAIKFLEIDPVNPGQNIFEYELPVTKKKVRFKFLTVGDEKEMAKAQAKAAAEKAKHDAELAKTKADKLMALAAQKAAEEAQKKAEEEEAKALAR